MTRRLLCLSGLALLTLPGPSFAQAVNGTAEWAFGRGLFESDAVRTRNDSFSQSYTVGYKSSVWDPRFLLYNAEVTFRTDRLSIGTQAGRSKDLGFRLGFNLFPARPFPFSMQITRDRIGESGDFQSASIIRGGIVLPPGAALPDFRTRNSGLQLNWHLSSPRLPRMEFGYRRSSSTVTGGGATARQRDGDLTASVYKETGRTRQTLRFQRNGSDNLISQVFNQRLSDLAYELTATSGARSRATLRAGRRSTFSLFDIPPSVTDIGAPTYQPPSRGSSTAYYSEGSYTWEPVNRVSADLTLNADREQGMQVSTEALLASSGATVEVLRGLTVTGRGTYGLRGQRVGSATRSVRTSAAAGGARYSTQIKFLHFGGGYIRSLGQNVATGEPAGQTRSWNGNAELGTAFSKGLNLSAGYEKGRGTDALLDFGNYAADRLRISASGSLTSRVVLQATWEDSRIERGRATLFSRNRYLVTSGSLGLRLWRGGAISLSGGQITNRLDDNDDDRTRFYGGSFDASCGRALSVSLNARKEAASVSLTGQRQDGLYSVAKIEYRLRLFTFVVEHRYTDTRQTFLRSAAFASLGSQVQFRVSRRFGF